MVSPARVQPIVDEEAVEPPVSQGTLTGSDGAPLPLERTVVEAHVAGPLADVSVHQRFRNDRAVAIEAVYRFPLPPEAAVYAMRFRLEDRVVEAVVKPKEEARRAYEQALAEGRAATLLEEDRPTLFTLSIANLAPGAVIDVELAYQDLLPYDDGQWRFAFPMTAPPTYAGAEGDAAPRALQRTRGHDVSVTVTFEAKHPVEDLSSPTHLVSVVVDPQGRTAVGLRLDAPIENRDFVLTWRAAEMGVRPWLWLDRREGTVGTFLLALTPSLPRPTTERGSGEGDVRAVRCGNCGGVVSDLSAIREIPGLGPVFPCAYCGAVLAPGVDVITRPSRARDVCVLVDRSASMRGSESQVRAVVTAVLSSLAPGDAVRLAVFDHSVEVMNAESNALAALSPEFVAQAEAFVAAHSPRGGSELESALAEASKMPAREGRTRVVVLVSDVAVGNEGRLLRRLPTLLGGAKLYVATVGHGADTRLAARVARAGGGACESVPVGPGAKEVLARLGRRVRESGPVLTNVTVYWQGATLRDLEPVAVPDLQAGEALRLLGRFEGSGASTLVITGLTADGRPYRQELAVNVPAVCSEARGLERAWARRRVERLSEAAQRGDLGSSAMESEGRELSLRWSIVGPWTSLVAVDQKVSVGPKRARRGGLYASGAVPSLTLDGVRRTIGRGTEADLHVDDGNVSRLHAEIVFDGEHFVIRDLASTNGTRVDGRAVRTSVLSEGNVIEVGNTRFTFLHVRGEGDEAFFEYVPTQRAVDARDGQGARAGAAVVKGEHDERLRHGEKAARLRSLAHDDEGEVMRSAMPRGPSGPVVPFPASAGPMPSPLGPPPSPMVPPSPMAFGAPGGGGPPPPMAPPAPMAAPARAAAPMMPGAPMPGAMPGGPMPGAPMPRTPAPVPPAARPAPAMPPMPGMAPPMPPMPGMAPPMPPMPGMAPPMPPMPVGMPAMGAPTPSREGAVYDPFGPPIGGLGPMPPSMGSPAPMTSYNQGTAPHAPVRTPGTESYPEHELQWLSTRVQGALDLVFLVDATGSMGPYIQQVRDRLMELLDVLRAAPLCRSLRVGLVAYRDHPPQERSFVTQVTGLTDSLDAVRAAVLTLAASGGGDGPECVTDGLFDVVRLDWRAGAAKAVVWFGDAPPHGVEPSGDAFPEGCPCGHHWHAQAESCREMGVLVYAIGCLPTLRAYQGAEAVFRSVARTTRGMFLPLREAGLLVPLIAGAAEAALDGQRIDAYLEALLATQGHLLANVDDHERARWIAGRFRAEGLRARAMVGDAERDGALPLKFREVSPVDVRASFARLRASGRLPAGL